ncbi:lectin [Rhizobium lusitanum]|uniref:Lectin-like protein BA14k n=1 Tax=Rhizobium lusitanum TaxID=293958 RepID=A0A6L9UI58_9HYPH|nr:BA14K family protein [Rhizobium lusitanum]NEI75001.1 lectin [Rhizobium lusitanum]
MKIISKTLSVAVLGVTLGLTSISAAGAVPMSGIVLPNAHDVEQVQWRHHHGGDGWYRGHRGYRDYRPGYRRHGDYWYPLAAFGAGALIGGALAAPTRPSYGSRHEEWCASRYRTYDPGTDTYVPRAGVRARCVSPY